jgi:chemotaxis protein histidine kinase CheA
MAFDLSKFIGRFVEEAREQVNTLNKGMLALEKDPGDLEIINQIFRSAHTIKGSSRMLKLLAISELAHKVEDALGALRAGTVQFCPGLGKALYQGVDALAGLVEKVARGEAIDEDRSELLRILAEAAEGRFAEVHPATAGPEIRPAAAGAGEDDSRDEMVGKDDASAGPVIRATEPRRQPEPRRATATGGISETIRVGTDKLSELIRLASEISSRHSRGKQSCQTSHEVWKQVERLANRVNACGGDIPAGFTLELESSLRLIGKELKNVSRSLKEDFILQELLVRDMQERSLHLRMLPLSTIFDSFHRTVREIAGDFGKEIDLSIIGDEIEMDKKIIEKLGDPLLHMFRNSIDHGIELPVERRQAGKPVQGRIRLTACYEGGKVLIVMEDDGRGLALEKIKAKALKNGLASSEALAGMSVSQIQNMIFIPGFSTSSIITDISGRGVGMDVVKRNIVDELKGSIDIDSAAGRGTVFQIRLPLTLAVMHVVLVEVGGAIFALPDNYIGEIIKVKAADVIEVMDRRAVNIREQLIPLEELHVILGLPPKSMIKRDELLLLVVKVGAERLGLIVESIIDEEDMVIKSLPRHMENNMLVSGVIITGRDDVVNVLNVPAVFLAAKETKSTLGREVADEVERQIRVLVVDDSINTREIEKSILEAYGYMVTMAGDGVEALEKARQSRFDIVISDVEMPRMDGFTLTETLRNEEGYKDTPIVLLTSRDKDEDKRRGIRVGANAYILKGDFEQSNLISTIESLV